VITRKTLKLFYREHLNYYEMANPRIFEVHAIRKMMADLCVASAHLGDIYYDLHKKDDSTLENIQELLNLANQIHDEYEKRYFDRSAELDS